MSEMSYMEKLLDGAEVEWKALGEVILLEKGRQLNKELLTEDGIYPAYNGGITYSGFTNTFNYGENTIIISQGGASAGFVNFVTSKFYANAHCYIVLPKSKTIENRYVYHFLKMNQRQLTENQHGAGIPALGKRQVLELQIPIPSIHIQNAIVRILDTFTELTSALTTELTNRKKQYNHYRDRLLSFEDGDVEWKALGEVCGFKNGFAFKSRLFRESGSPIIRITNIDGKNVTLEEVKYFDPTDYKEELHSFIVNSGDILVAMSGATTGKIGCYNYNKVAYINQRVGKFIPKPKSLNNRYLYHNLLSRSREMFIMAGGGAQPNLSSSALMDKLQIPIPYPNNSEKSLAEQARTAAILDKFDTLTHSISDGLPREIELRQKQYEYYRNMLLSFPKPETSA